MKDLNLVRDNLRPAIIKFFTFKETSANVSILKYVAGTRQRIDIELNDNKFFIDFHFKVNGTTTIDISGGGTSHKELKEEIAHFIMEEPCCIIGGDLHGKAKWFIAPNINFEDFNGIIELLTENEYYRSHVKESNETSDFYRIKGKHDDEITIHFYKTTNKVMVQGRPLYLFNEFVIYVTELLDLERIPEVFNEYYNIEIEKDNIESMFQRYFPVSHASHTPKLRNVLLQAVYNLQLEGDMYDYTYLAFPALKALEGHLKIILTNKGITLENNCFSMYEKNHSTGKYILKSDFHATAGAHAMIKYLEDAYNFYNRHRHSTFHWADTSAPIDLTRLIDSPAEAKGLINNSFEIIEKYYTI